MRKRWRCVDCAVRLFLLGGGVYVLLEKLWRGYSHWTMFLLGGACFHLMGQVGARCCRWPLRRRCALCAGLVTAAEFLCGCVVNRALKMNVWDYSRYPLQFMGQICLPYTLLWGLLSIPGMAVYKACHGLYYRLRS